MVVQRADRKRVSFKGVAIGNVVDIVASNVVMVPVIYVLASAKTGSATGDLRVEARYFLNNGNLGIALGLIGLNCFNKSGLSRMLGSAIFGMEARAGRENWMHCHRSPAIGMG